MEKLSAEKSKQNLARIQQSHAEVRSLLGLALDCDEKNEHSEAIQLYEQVSQQISSALSLELFEHDRCALPASLCAQFSI
jgi:hypothetical protein